MTTDSEPRPRWRRSALRHLAPWTAWFAGGWLVATVLWVALPSLLIGWNPTVVVSESMSPAIRKGDVVHIASGRPVDEVGAVIRYQDETGGFTLHRVLHVLDDGMLQTKGDANGRPDSQPVDPADVTGRGVLLVPYAVHPITLAACALVMIASGASVVHRRRTAATDPG